jgi:putative ABC transport system permease protein
LSALQHSLPAGEQWPLFAVAGLICLLIMLLTISTQAVRTAFVNPVQQLRTD